MKTFQIGESVVCYTEVYRSSALYDPVPDSGSAVTVAIYTEAGTTILAATACGKESTGKYSHTWSSTGSSAGKYRARFTYTDGTTVTIKDGSFMLEN